MEPQKKTLIVTTIALLLVLVLVFGTIFYLVKFIQSRQKQASTQTTFQTSTSSAIPTFNPLQVATGSAALNSADANSKTYNAAGIQISYPKTWGLLTCSNSENIEFDPYNKTDQLKVACDLAQKPITVLVGPNSCPGDVVKLGSVTVTKSKTTTTTGVKYRWCTKTTPSLDITHRVSTETKRGFSKDDFSAEIEKMISTLRFANGS